MAHLVSVNVGRPRPAAWTAIGRTSIDKTPVTAPVPARRLGLDGDEVSNRRHHGGPDKAVYAYAVEDLERWSAVLGTDLVPGQFGENLTTRGLDVNEVEIGSRWLVGGALLEVTCMRTPCATFRGWQQQCGLDAAGWLRRFTADARPGPYLKVLGEGPVQVGDAVEVVHEPGHGVTVSLMFRALMGESDLLPRLLDVPDLVPEARAVAESHSRGAAHPRGSGSPGLST